MRRDDLRQLLNEMRGTIQRLAEKSQPELDFDPASLQGDPNLGLKMVAVELGLSEKYLSALFKDQTGENFGAYVENRRMERAAQLLEDSRVQMKDVAELSGYQNANTFYNSIQATVRSEPRAIPTDA